MLRSFPLLAIAVILYNLVAFGWIFAGHHDVLGLLSWGFTLQTFSGDAWTITGSDLVLLFAFVLLFMEVVKSTRASARALPSHALSLLTFAAALAEFLLLRGFSTSVFFFIVLMTLFDTMAGYTISALAAKRDAEPSHAEEDGQP